VIKYIYPAKRKGEHMEPPPSVDEIDMLRHAFASLDELDRWVAMMSERRNARFLLLIAATVLGSYEHVLFGHGEYTAWLRQLTLPPNVRQNNKRAQSRVESSRVYKLHWKRDAAGPGDWEIEMIVPDGIEQLLSDEELLYLAARSAYRRAQKAIE
jgi:hypothetical protein